MVTDCSVGLSVSHDGMLALIVYGILTTWVKAMKTSLCLLFLVFWWREWKACLRNLCLLFLVFWWHLWESWKQLVFRVYSILVIFVWGMLAQFVLIVVVMVVSHDDEFITSFRGNPFKFIFHFFTLTKRNLLVKTVNS